MFQLAFEAVTGIDYHSDIAIDDVTIQDGVCPEPLLQCSFETTDICGFIQVCTVLRFTCLSNFLFAFRSLFII